MSKSFGTRVNTLSNFLDESFDLPQLLEARRRAILIVFNL
jgi:hypothetical protein